MLKSRVWGNEIPIKIKPVSATKAKMAILLNTGGSCSRKIETFTYMGNANMLYNFGIEFMVYYKLKKLLIHIGGL